MIEAVMLWNEPNNLSHWNFEIDPGWEQFSKMVNTAAEAVRAVYALGQREFGENYVQEAAAKMDALADLDGLRWHLIGPLQANKTTTAAGRFAWVETVDRMKIAERLARARPANAPASSRWTSAPIPRRRWAVASAWPRPTRGRCS